MATQNNLPSHQSSFAKPLLIGATIGLLIISFFVFSVSHPNPAWGKLWMIRPLLVVPLAGASGGAFYYFMDYQASKGLNRTVAILLSGLVFSIGLWMGIVLGLNGTLWN